jgi:DNA primase large subunit
MHVRAHSCLLPSHHVLQSDVEALLKKHMQGTSRQQTYRKDVLSHHILRLAYCRTADLRNWLLAQEALLFKYRFRLLTRAQQVRHGPLLHHLLLLFTHSSMSEHQLAEWCIVPMPDREHKGMSARQ